MSPSARCVVHPARRAVDACPACGRARCAVDAAAWGARGCAACGQTQSPAAPPPGDAETFVRAGLAGAVTALVGGFVATQYVDTHYFSLIAPALVGLAAAWAVPLAAGPRATEWRVPLLALAAAAALVGTALGFRLVPGGQPILSPLGEVGPPYLAAVVGVLAWPALFGPPRRREPAEPPTRADDRADRPAQPAGRGSER